MSAEVRAWAECLRAGKLPADSAAVADYLEAAGRKASAKAESARQLNASKRARVRGAIRRAIGLPPVGWECMDSRILIDTTIGAITTKGLGHLGLNAMPDRRTILATWEDMRRDYEPYLHADSICAGRPQQWFTIISPESLAHEQSRAEDSPRL